MFKKILLGVVISVLGFSVSFGILARKPQTIKPTDIIITGETFHRLKKPVDLDMGASKAAKIIKESQISAAGFSAGRVWFPSLSIDNGTLYVAYVDVANDEKCTVMKYDRGKWKPVGSIGFSDSTINSPTLFVSKGTAYVAYYKREALDFIHTVMKFDGSNWVSLGSFNQPNFSLYVYDGTPYIAYQDKTHNNKFTIQKHDGTNWIDAFGIGFYSPLRPQELVSVSRAPKVSLSLCLDSGNPYVAYDDQANGNKLSLANYNGSIWLWVSSVVMPSDAELGPTTAQLARTHTVAQNIKLYVYDGTPYVVFNDFLSGNAYKIMKYDFASQAWLMVGSPFEATSLSFFNYEGVPYVAYTDLTNARRGLPDNDKIIVSKYDSNNNNWIPLDFTKWEFEGSFGFSAGAPYSPSLFVDNGIPYVAYGDGANGGKATVMKYIGK